MQVAVCDYLRARYPDVMFLSDTIAAVKLTVMQAVRNKKIQKPGFKCPDLLILATRSSEFGDRVGACGLFLELKAETPFKKDGTLKSNEHLAEQAKTGKALISEGYDFYFVWTFDQAKEIIDGYLRKRR